MLRKVLSEQHDPGLQRRPTQASRNPGRRPAQESGNVRTGNHRTALKAYSSVYGSVHLGDVEAPRLRVQAIDVLSHETVKVSHGFETGEREMSGVGAGLRKTRETPGIERPEAHWVVMECLDGGNGRGVDGRPQPRARTPEIRYARSGRDTRTRECYHATRLPHEFGDMDECFHAKKCINSASEGISGAAPRVVRRLRRRRVCYAPPAA